jgi:DNA (cytosine-5)-methyltransferase 1
VSLRYLSVCSGIEAATVAWEPLGWKPLAFSEIEAFQRAVLAHHYPTVPLFGDFTRLRGYDWIKDADLLVGGTPCQAFSLAGLRKSLGDDRGNLSLEFIRLANAVDDLRLAAGRPAAWIVWENVPGVLNVRDNAFGAFLAGLVGDDAPLETPSGKWPDSGVVAGPERVAAWRCLDAQHFGLAQRRKRVFVLARGGAGRWQCADALLPIIDRLHGHPAPRRGEGEGSAADAEGGAGSCLTAFGGNNTQGPIQITPALLSHHGAGYKIDFESETLIAETPRAFPDLAYAPICFSSKDWAQDAREDIAPTLRAMNAVDGNANAGGQLAVAFALRGREGGAMPEVHGDGDQVGTLRACGGGSSRDYVATTRVRRLTPLECERLQGFPDNYTRIPMRTYASKPRSKHVLKYPDHYEELADGRWLRFFEDGPRYRSLGNSMATDVMAYIGRRIEAVRGEG